MFFFTLQSEMHAYNSISLHFNCRTFHTMPAQWRRRLPTLTQLYCGRHVASFLKVWKGSQSDPNYLDKQKNSLLIPFLSLQFFYMLPERGGGGFIFINFSVCKFNENACSVKRGGEGLALLDATCLLGSWRTFTYTLQFLAH